MRLLEPALDVVERRAPGQLDQVEAGTLAALVSNLDGEQPRRGRRVPLIPATVSGERGPHDFSGVVAAPATACCDPGHCERHERHHEAPAGLHRPTNLMPELSSSQPSRDPRGGALIGGTRRLLPLCGDSPQGQHLRCARLPLLEVPARREEGEALGGLALVGVNRDARRLGRRSLPLPDRVRREPEGADLLDHLDGSERELPVRLDRQLELVGGRVP